MENPKTTTPAARPEEMSSPSSVGLQWLREIVNAAIAITILAISSVMLMQTFNSAKNLTASSASNAGQQTQLDPAQQAEMKDALRAERDQREKAFSSEKDILLYGLALLGTVTGYFFGRVPAELHAVQAQKAANVAQDRADDAKDAESKAKADKTRIMDKTMTTLNQTLATPPFAHPASRDVPDAAQSAARITTARQDLEGLRDWLHEMQS